MTEQEAVKEQTPTQISVLGYTRQSKDEYEHVNSIDDQKKRIEQFCLLHNFKLADTITEIHSSKEGKLKLLKEAADKVITEPLLSGLVVAYTNRLGRDDILPRVIARDLYKAQKRLYCCDIEADIRTPSGYTLFSILVMMANIENLNKGQLVKNVLETIRTKEKRITFKSWTGFSFNEEKHLIPHPYNAEVIRKIFTLTASGVQITKICEESIIEKHSFINGKRTLLKVPIPLMSFYRIIHNPIYYTGSYNFKGQIINFQPLITKQLFDKAQYIIKKRTKNAGA